MFESEGEVHTTDFALSAPAEIDVDLAEPRPAAEKEAGR